MSDFEAQCDCELDSPGVMSEQPIELRLECWTDWALYLKARIETHYRPRIAKLDAEVERLNKTISEMSDMEKATFTSEYGTRYSMDELMRVVLDYEDAERGGEEEK